MNKQSAAIKTMKVVILAGGQGTRLSEETTVRPKPMVEIGGRPILWHIMKYYNAFGFRNFVVALGYKGEHIKEYFLNYGRLHGDILIDYGRSVVSRSNNDVEDWNVHLADTGLETMTGGRLLRLRSVLESEPFMLTYGDGVSTVDLDALAALHQSSGAVATLTAIHPPARFGGLEFDGDKISHFAEKSSVNIGWINGGFMVFSPKIFDYLKDDRTILEYHALERLSAEGKLAGYRHEGFWQCMDSLRDKTALEAMWNSGNPPWKIW